MYFFFVLFLDGRNVGVVMVIIGMRNVDSIFCVCLYLLENVKRWGVILVMSEELILDVEVSGSE